MAHAPLTRRALREARARGEQPSTTMIDTATRVEAETRADTAVETLPIPIIESDGDGPTHPPIFKPPPPPLPEGGLRSVPHPLTTKSAHARHARKPRVGLTAQLSMAAASLLVVVGGASAVALTNAPDETAPVAQTAPVADITGSKVGPRLIEPSDEASDAAAARPADTDAPTGQSLASLALCDTTAFTKALDAGDDAAAIEVAGGADDFRDAVAGGQAPCVSLTDPAHVWVVVDKTHPLRPKEYAPSPRQQPKHVQSLDGSGLRTDAAAALSELAAASRAADAGDIALNSGYRSYKTQVGNYRAQKTERGTQGADAVSARPGYSEHQTGLAADIVPCTDNGACATLDDVDASAQGDWIAAHSWKYGWVVRYEKGETGVTGYSPEPWHLRYIGPELAAAYHDGGFHTLEEFFGLPAAPDYAD